MKARLLFLSSLVVSFTWGCSALRGGQELSLVKKELYAIQQQIAGGDINDPIVSWVLVAGVIVVSLIPFATLAYILSHRSPFLRTLIDKLKGKPNGKSEDREREDCYDVHSEGRCDSS